MVLLRFAYSIIFFQLLLSMCTHARDQEVEKQNLKNKFLDAYSLKSRTMQDQISLKKYNSEKFSGQKFHSQFDSNTNEVVKINSLQVYYKFLNDLAEKTPAWINPRSEYSGMTKCENFLLDHVEASYLGLLNNIDSIYPGKIMPIYFPIKDHPSQLIMPKEIANFPNKNPLELCGVKPNDDQAETKFCATSMDSMLDYIRRVFGSEAGFKFIETTHYRTSPTTLLQDYVVSESPQEIESTMKVFCHPINHAFLCHFDTEGAKVVKVLLGGENGDRVEAIGVCHMDTTGWIHDHIAFRLLQVKPGSPVCHFLPAGNLVWMQTSTSIWSNVM